MRQISLQFDQSSHPIIVHTSPTRCHLPKYSVQYHQNVDNQTKLNWGSSEDWLKCLIDL